MSLATDAAALGLLFCRLSGMLIASPFFSLKSLPTVFKALLTLGLALILYPTLPVPEVAWPTPAALGVAAVWELAVGVWLGFLTGMAGAVATSAGSLLDLQMGLSNATLVDPMHGESRPLIASGYQMLLVLLMLGCDAHHALLSMLARSFTLFPLGHGFNRALAPMVAGSAMHFFPLVLSLALPLLLAMLGVDMILAFVSKLAPQMNMMVAGAAFKLGLGWMLVVLSLPTTLRGMDQLIQDCWRVV